MISIRKSYITLYNRIKCTNLTFLSGTSNTTCWKCGSKLNIGDLFCSNCKIIQKPQDTKNYFRVFDFNEEFHVDNKVLTQKYRNMQSLLHPDKFSNKTEEERTISQDYSSLLNKAYTTLLVPLNRALHILLLNKIEINEDDKVSDPNFLMEMMELNEEIEEADDEKTLRRLSDKNKEMIEGIILEIGDNFKLGQLVEAKESVVKMKYYNSISKRINDLMRERGIVD